MELWPRFKRLDQKLTELLARSEAERPAYLAQLAEEDPALAAELRKLVARADRAEQFLSLQAGSARDRMLSRALHLDDLFGAREASRVGQSVGPYCLEQELARTGHSEVYLARREDPEWQQQVAIKILTRGMNSDDVLRRFLAERQILSFLHHPHIATLLDGGMTPDGLPYFVMEHIDGQPVTHYCRSVRPDLGQRVELCRQICLAVAFAHRHLVVHRDLKPSNIMVTTAGQVKLLDFGIAKLLDPIIDPAIAPQTQEYGRPMTLPYASPEQQAGGVITTASDVYQLGRVFTEMLTDSTTWSAAPGDGQRAAEPERASAVAARCGGELPYLPGALRGDLDWILLKAQALRPEDRYGSAAELLEDLDRYRRQEPVGARRATVPYLVNKFARRRPALSASLFALSLTAIVLVVVLGAFNLQLERERTAAVLAAERAEEVQRLLVDFIAAPDPFAGSGADAVVSEVLQASEADIDRTLANRPQLRMELLGLLADVYQNLALHERSVAVRETELQLRRELGVWNEVETLQSRRKQAQSRQALGETDRALAEFEELLAELASRQPPSPAEQAVVETAIGAIHANYGDAGRALPFLEAAVERLRTVDSGQVLLADALHQKALAVGYLGRHEEAYALMEEAFRLRTQHQGPDHVATLAEQTMIAANLTNRGRYAESIEIYAELLPVLERRLGPLHERVLTIMNNSAVSHDLAGRLEESATLHREVLARRRQKFGDTHGDVAESLQNLGAVLTRLERYDEALATLREAARLFPSVYQPDSPRLAFPHVSLAIVYAHTGPVALQEEEARTALSLLDGKVPESHPAVLRVRCLLGDALARRGDRAAGLPLMEQAIAGLTQEISISPAHLETCRAALYRALADGDGASR